MKRTRRTAGRIWDLAGSRSSEVFPIPMFIGPPEVEEVRTRRYRRAAALEIISSWLRLATRG